VSGSTVARVRHINHGFRSGDSVTISGSEVYNGTYSITNAREDFYYVTLGAAATVTDNVGGVAVIATNNVRYEGGMISTQVFVPNKTTLNSTMSGVLVGGIETTTNIVPINEPIFSPVSRYLLSEENELATISGQKSARVTLGISSVSDYVSPLIAFDSMDFMTVSNVIDNPDTSLNVASSADIETISAGSCTFEADDDSMLVTNNINSFVTGAYLKLTSLFTNAVLNDTYIKILRVDSSENKVYLDAVILDETVTPVIKQHVAFVDEISQTRGTTNGKYVSKQIRLDSTSTALRIMYAANIPNAAEVDLYYRIGVNDISKVVWTKVPTAYKKSTTELEFLDQEYTLDNLAGFTTYQIKIVMRSTNKAAVPKIKNLRGIALA
jgi:hypothetical protein